MTVSVRTVRLTCSEFYVDAPLTAPSRGPLAGVSRHSGRAEHGPGDTPEDALMGALQPFEAMVDELLACLPPDLSNDREGNS